MTPTEVSLGRESAEECIARLRSRITELERERAEIDAFAATAAHELLEPLVMIEAYAATIGEQFSVSGGGEPALVADLGRAASRLRRLVEMILHDARSSADLLRSEDVDLRAVALEVVALYRRQIEARGVAVEVDELPSVRGDEALLGSVVSNLLSNALKHGARSGGRIEIRAERREHWYVIIGDDGPHILEADRARIFEPFQRSPRGPRSRGAGLGLAICKRIVERHGGTIGVAAGERGNEFFFTLPA